MKPLAALLAIAATAVPIASAGDPRDDFAKSVTRVPDLQKLIEDSFGGGTRYRVEGSDFWVVDLHRTSGVPSTELYVYRESESALALRAFVPLKPYVERKTEYGDGKLIVSEKPVDGSTWQVVVELYE